MTDTITLPRTSRRLKEEEEQKTKRQPPYNVVLLNDDDHSYEYVRRDEVTPERRHLSRLRCAGRARRRDLIARAQKREIQHKERNE